MSHVHDHARNGLYQVRNLVSPFRKIIAEFSKFGVVGLIALVIDVGLFNILLFASPGDFFSERPLTAKAIAVIVATTASYFLNRSWTYADRSRTGVAREYVLFVVINGIAMLMTLGVLWFSHYALGLTSPLADNISANVIGLAVGTAFRFWAYRTWVFPEAAGLEQLPEDVDSMIEAEAAGSAHR